MFLLNFSALTEKIVAVLALMKCPHRIEPHQIQGLDFKNIFNAVQVYYNIDQIYSWKIKFINFLVAR